MSNWPPSTLPKRMTSIQGGSRTTVTSKIELFLTQISGWKSLTTVTGRGG